MSLLKSKPLFVTADALPKKEASVKDKIQQRRYQILVHSLLYYAVDHTLVSDAKWQQWADELVKLQREYPIEADSVIFSKSFKNFDGTTGFDLPFTDQQIVNIAYRLLQQQVEDADESEAIHKIRILETTPAEYSGHSKKVTPVPARKKETVRHEKEPRKSLFGKPRT